MTPEGSVVRLLRWRAMLAERDAPPPPSAVALLRRRQPWWERWPAEFAALAGRARAIPTAYGYAMTAAPAGRAGHPVPTIVATGERRADGEVASIDTFARIGYLSVQDGRLRLRFQLDPPPPRPGASYEVTFVAEDEASPLFAAIADEATAGELRVDAELPDALARDWAALRVTDRMPFRLVLRAAGDR